MKQDINHREVFDRPDRLSDDFALLLQAFTDAFRGLSSSSRLESHWSELRGCGGEC